MTTSLANEKAVVCRQGALCRRVMNILSYKTAKMFDQRPMLRNLQIHILAHRPLNCLKHRNIRCIKSNIRQRNPSACICCDFSTLYLFIYLLYYLFIYLFRGKLKYLHSSCSSPGFGLNIFYSSQGMIRGSGRSKSYVGLNNIY